LFIIIFLKFKAAQSSRDCGKKIAYYGSQGNCGIIDDLELPTNASVTWSPRCPYPSYYSYIGVLALVVISMPVYICYLGKAFLMFMLAGAQCTVNVLFLGSTLDHEDMVSTSPGQNIFHLKYSLSATLLTTAVALVVVSRYVSLLTLTYSYFLNIFNVYKYI
jgi:hypothetical protein